MIPLRPDLCGSSIARARR